jgi:hypothetical protein
MLSRETDKTTASKSSIRRLHETMPRPPLFPLYTEAAAVPRAAGGGAGNGGGGCAAAGAGAAVPGTAQELLEVAAVLGSCCFFDAANRSAVSSVPAWVPPPLSAAGSRAAEEAA